MSDSINSVNVLSIDEERRKFRVILGFTGAGAGGNPNRIDIPGQFTVMPLLILVLAQLLIKDSLNYYLSKLLMLVILLPLLQLLAVMLLLLLVQVLQLLMPYYVVILLEKI